MAGNIKYGALNIPESLIEELKVWKMAFSMVSGRAVSYAEMIRSMLEHINDFNPEVYSAWRKLLEMNPSLINKLEHNNDC